MEFPSVRPGEALRRAKASASKRFGGILARDKDTSKTATRQVPAVAGVLYKRRSGVTGLAASLFSQGDKSAGNGKYGGRLWVMRYVELRDGVLSYYDLPKGFEERPELGDFSPEPGSERGSIDLRRFGVQLRLSAGHVSHMSHLVAGLQGSGKESPPAEGHTVPNADGVGSLHGTESQASLGSAAGVGAAAGAVAQSMGGAAVTTSSAGTPLASADETRLDRVPSEGDFGGDSPSGAVDRDKDVTRSPSPYLMEIIYNNMLLPKEWQSWTLCAPDCKSLFKWTSAISGVIFNVMDEASEFGQDATTPTGAESVTPSTADLDPSRPGTPAVRLADELRLDTVQDENDYENGHEEHDIALGAPAALALSPSLLQQQQQQRLSPSPLQSLPSQRGSRMVVSPETTPLPTSRLSPRRLSSLGASPLSPARMRGPPSSAAALPPPSRLPWPLRAISRADLAVALCVATVLLNAAGERELKQHVQLAALTIAVALLGAAVQALEGGAAQAGAAQHELAVTSPRGGGSRRALAPPKLDLTLPTSRSASGPASGSASGSASASTGRPQAPLKERTGGLTVPYLPTERAKAEGHCWTDCDDSVLSMRVGPDYRKNGFKAATKPALFKTVGVDLFESDKKLNDVAHAVKAPLDKCVDGALLPEPWPRLLVFNFQLPSPNGMGLSSADGPGYNFACYYTPSEALIEQIRAAEQGRPVEPAVALLRRWFAEASTNVALKERLKLVGFILNPDDCGMPGWTQRYNGKPVMIKKSATIAHDAASRIVEYDIDLRVWGIATRQGIRALLPAALAKMEFIVSLVIQGEENEELPERALTATQLYYLQTDKAVRT